MHTYNCMFRCELITDVQLYDKSTHDFKKNDKNIKSSIPLPKSTLCMKVCRGQMYFCTRINYFEQETVSMIKLIHNLSALIATCLGCQLLSAINYGLRNSCILTEYMLRDRLKKKKKSKWASDVLRETICIHSAFYMKLSGKKKGLMSQILSSKNRYTEQ